VSTADSHRRWLLELERCASTNDWALARLADLAHGVAVLAREQIAGRGRDGSAWVATAGTTTVSYVLRLERAASGRLLSLAAGLAVVHAVRDLCPGLAPLIKWPNDVYLADRKLAGVLCEARNHGDGLKVVVGIGLNRAGRWSAEAQSGFSHPATSLEEHTTPPEEIELVRTIRDHLLDAVGLLRAGRGEAIVELLEHHDWLRGRLVRVGERNRQATGSAAGIDAEGRLLITGADGAPSAVSTGSVTLLEQDGAGV